MKCTSQMNKVELKELDFKINHLKGLNKIPQKTKSFVAGIRRWYKGHGKLSENQTYWVDYWYNEHKNKQNA